VAPRVATGVCHGELEEDVLAARVLEQSRAVSVSCDVLRLVDEVVVFVEGCVVGLSIRVSNK
jgi:hypothetical protein